MKEETLRVGDLVYHLIHGKQWLAVVLNTDLVSENCINKKQLCREYVLVHMQGGTEYEDFFRTSHPSIKVTDHSGLISYHWLRKISYEGW